MSPSSSSSSLAPEFPPQLVIKKSKDLLDHLQALLDTDSNIILRTNMAEHITILSLNLEKLINNNNNNTNVLSILKNYHLRLNNLLNSIKILKIIPNNLNLINYFNIKLYNNLEILWLDQCPPSTVNNLYSLKNKLIKIFIYNSGITNLTSHFSPISRKVLNVLKPMVLINNPTKNINPKYQWSQLKTLVLSNCGINYMDECFHFFPSLEALDLSYNNITHVVHLQDCYSLISLNLSHNRIRVLSNLDRVLGKVKFLNLSSNKIESLDGIDKLYSLETLNLSSNYIKDFNEAQHLIQLPCLTSLFLTSNPIETSSKNQYRLKIFFFYIKYGKIFNGFYSLPILDGKKISKTEKKKLKKIIYSRTIDTCKELTLDREDIDFSIDDFCDDDLATTNYNSESEDESVSGSHGIRVSFNNNSYRTRSYSGVNSLNSSGGSSTGSGSISRLSNYGPSSFEDISTRRISTAPASPSPLNRTVSQGSLSPYSNRHSIDRRSIAPISKNDFLRMRLSSVTPNSSGSSANARNSIIGRNSLIMKKFSLKQSNRVKRNALIIDSKQDNKNGEDFNKENYDQNEINEFFSVIENDIKYNGMLWQKFVDPLPLIFIENKEKEPKERERGLSSASISSLPLSSSSELESSMELVSSNPNAGLILHPSLEALSTESVGPSSLRNSFLQNAPPVNVTGLGNNFIDKDIPSPRPSFSSSRKNSNAVNSFSAAAAATYSSSLTSSYDVISSPLSPKKSISSFSFSSTTPSASASKIIADASSTFLSEIDPYVGDSQYKDLNVLENLEVYLREQVFSIKRPSFPNLFLKNKLNQKVNSAEPASVGPNSSFSSNSFSSPPNHDYSLRLITPYSSSERFIALYIEKVIDVKEIIKEKRKRNNKYFENDVESDDGTSREGGGDLNEEKDEEGKLVVTSSPEFVKEEETDTEETEEEEDIIYEKKIGIILTDIGIYIIDLMDISSTLLFKDTPLLSVLRQHPLYKLNLCTIYFGFQRCLLGFLKDPYHSGKDSSSSSSTSSYLNPLTNSAAYTAIYMVITRDKSRMYPIITRIPQVANQRRNNLKPISLRNVIINNNDNELLDGLMKFNNNNDRDIIYYQMIFMIKRNKKKTAINTKEITNGGNMGNDLSSTSASTATLSNSLEYKTTRSILITKFFIFLCYENLYKKKIKLKLIDSSNLKDIEKVFIDENNPMYITIQFKRLNMFGSKRKWRLCTEGRNPCDKLLEEVKRACYEVGNQLP